MDEIIGEVFGVVIREISFRVYWYIELSILRDLEFKFYNLKFEIFEELFVSINFVLVFVIVVFFYLFFDIIVVVRFLIVIFIWFVDVNFKDWWDKIVEEIYSIIDRNKVYMLRNIEDEF